MIGKHWLLTCLLSASTWGSLSAQQHTVGVYQSGIRFESKQYPDYFLGFTNKSSALGLLSDAVDRNKTLWYIEEKPGCTSNDVKGYTLRSLAFPQYYITTNVSSNLLFIGKASTPLCFTLVYNASHKPGVWYNIELPKAPVYSLLGLVSGKKVAALSQLKKP